LEVFKIDQEVAPTTTINHEYLLDDLLSVLVPLWLFHKLLD